MTTQERLPRVMVVCAPAPRDRAITARLGRLLRAYEAPTDASTTFQRLSAVTLDDPTGDIVPDKETDALIDEASHLLLVCSPAAVGSRRIVAIVERFLQTHDVDRVLPLLTEGDLFGSLPAPYLRRITQTIELNGVQHTVVDQLVVSLPAHGRWRRWRALPIAMLRLIAPILGTTFDALYRRILQRRRRRRAALALVSLLSAVALLALAAWLSTVEAWTSEAINSHWAQNTGMLGQFPGTDSTKVTAKVLDDGHLLMHGFRDGSFSLWSPPAAQRVWRSPLRLIDNRSDRPYWLAVTEDSLSVVAVDRFSGRTISTPFKLSAPMAQFNAVWNTHGDVLLVQTSEARRIVAWSPDTNRQLPEIDDIAAPATDADRRVNLGPMPAEWFLSNATLTADARYLVAPCLRDGRITTCVRTFASQSEATRLAVHLNSSFVGYLVDEHQGVVVTAERYDGGGAMAVWSLGTAKLISQRAFGKSDEAWIRIWPRFSTSRSHIVLDHGLYSAIIPITALRMPPSQFAVARTAARFMGPTAALNADAIAWQEPTGTVVWNIDRRGDRHVLPGLDLGEFERFVVQTTLHRFVGVGRSSIEIWDLSGSRMGHPIPITPRMNTAVTMDGTALTIHEFDGKLSVVDLSSGALVVEIPFVAGSSAVAYYSPNRRRVDLYTETGTLVRHEWRRTNSLQRAWRRLMPLGSAPSEDE